MSIKKQTEGEMEWFESLVMSLCSPKQWQRLRVDVPLCSLSKTPYLPKSISVSLSLSLSLSLSQPHPRNSSESLLGKTMHM